MEMWLLVGGYTSTAYQKTNVSVADGLPEDLTQAQRDAIEALLAEIHGWNEQIERGSFPANFEAKTDKEMFFNGPGIGAFLNNLSIRPINHLVIKRYIVIHST